jgi:flavin reductase (DIM6/NTAB) family NADH-FMN oxidoreductase RutF
MSVDSDTLRSLTGSFATGCTVVTMSDENGDPHGLTANAFSSVSLEPPLVLVCIDHGTNSYELLENEDVDGFSINILSKAQKDLGEYFANMTELDDDPFETRTREELETSAPVFEQAIAYLDCSIFERHPAGDHTIYVGKVQQGDTLHSDAEPLAFYQGEWGTVVPDE